MRKLSVFLILAAAFSSLGIGEWREAASGEPARVEFRTAVTEQQVTDGGGAAVRWRLAPMEVLCGNRFEVVLQATGWAPVVRGGPSLPIPNLGLVVECQPTGERKTVSTDRDGRATVSFTAAADPAVHTISIALARPSTAFYLEPPRAIGSFRYRMEWVRYAPDTRKGRANYLDPVTITSRVVRDIVTHEGHRLTWGVTVPNDHLKGVRVAAAPSVRWTWNGQEAAGRILVASTAEDGWFDVTARGRFPGREAVNATPEATRAGIVFTGTFAPPTWVEFLGEDRSWAAAWDCLIRPAGARRDSRMQPDTAGNWFVDLGSVEVGRLVDPPREMAVEAYVPRLADTPASRATAHFRNTVGSVMMVNNAAPATGGDGIFRSGGKVPAWHTVLRPGENLIEVTSPDAANKVTFRIFGLGSDQATAMDPGQTVQLAGTASPNPVDLRTTERSTVSGNWSLGTYGADTQAELRVMVEHGTLEVAPAERRGDIRQNREGSWFANLKTDPAGRYQFQVRRTTPGRARVSVYIWSPRFNQTLREVKFEIEFKLAPAVRVEDGGGVSIDLGGFRIGIPRTGRGSTGGTSTGGTTTGGSGESTGGTSTGSTGGTSTGGSSENAWVCPVHGAGCTNPACR